MISRCIEIVDYIALDEPCEGLCIRIPEQSFAQPALRRVSAAPGVFWIEALSLLGRLSDGALALHELLKLKVRIHLSLNYSQANFITRSLDRLRA
jgi:hypothetical protein